MAPTFNDFCFDNDVDTIGLVETDFGFHVIKVTDKEDVVKKQHFQGCWAFRRN